MLVSIIDSSSDENDVRTCTKRNEANEFTGRNILYNELNGVIARFCSSSNLYEFMFFNYCSTHLKRSLYFLCIH